MRYTDSRWWCPKATEAWTKLNTASQLCDILMLPLKEIVYCAWNFRQLNIKKWLASCTSKSLQTCFSPVSFAMQRLLSFKQQKKDGMLTKKSLKLWNRTITAVTFSGETLFSFLFYPFSERKKLKVVFFRYPPIWMENTIKF